VKLSKTDDEQWSFSDHGRALPSNSQNLLTQIASWLSDVGLFKQAWSLVCFGPLNWWLSEQLCLFTARVWTVFVATEGEPGFQNLDLFLANG
jgi:hypothetical protein